MWVPGFPSGTMIVHSWARSCLFEIIHLPIWIFFLFFFFHFITSGRAVCPVWFNKLWCITCFYGNQTVVSLTFYLTLHLSIIKAAWRDCSIWMSQNAECIFHVCFVFTFIHRRLKPRIKWEMNLVSDII